MELEDGQAQKLSDHPNGHSGDQITARPSKDRKSSFQCTIEQFSLLWFAIPMNTGALGILMHNLPYQFRGLPVLATIMYVFELVQFVIIAIVTILRWTLYPKGAMKNTAGSLDQISFFGCPPIAFMTLVGQTALIVSNAYWGGHAWSLVAYVMWWFGVAWMVATGTTPFHFMQERGSLTVTCCKA